MFLLMIIMDESIVDLYVCFTKIKHLPLWWKRIKHTHTQRRYSKPVKHLKPTNTGHTEILRNNLTFSHTFSLKHFRWIHFIGYYHHIKHQKTTCFDGLPICIGEDYKFQKNFKEILENQQHLKKTLITIE